jgi:hypothetical protein
MNHAWQGITGSGFPFEFVTVGSLTKVVTGVTSSNTLVE